MGTVPREMCHFWILLESDSLRRLGGGISFLLGLIRGGGGIVHVPRSAEVPRFSLIYLNRELFIYIF